MLVFLPLNINPCESLRITDQFVSIWLNHPKLHLFPDLWMCSYFPLFKMKIGCLHCVSSWTGTLWMGGDVSSYGSAYAFSLMLHPCLCQYAQLCCHCCLSICISLFNIHAFFISLIFLPCCLSLCIFVRFPVNFTLSFWDQILTLSWTVTFFIELHFLCAQQEML